MRETRLVWTRAADGLPDTMRSVLVLIPDDAGMQLESSAYLVKHGEVDVWVYHYPVLGTLPVRSEDLWAYWPDVDEAVSAHAAGDAA